MILSIQAAKMQIALSAKLSAISRNIPNMGRIEPDLGARI